MSDKRTKMERIAVQCYPGLLKVLGSDADALEMMCGIYAAGEMRAGFLEAVFGREVRRVSSALDKECADGEWASDYPAISRAREHLK